jgi:hypothetical protein
MEPSSHHRLWPWIAVPIFILITIAGLIGPYSGEFALGTFSLLALYLLRHSTRLLSAAADQAHSFSAPVHVSSRRWMLVCEYCNFTCQHERKRGERPRECYCEAPW